MHKTKRRINLIKNTYGDNMQTKLTLRMESDLINSAKTAAEKKGKSLSKMVADYFTLITKTEVEQKNDIPPNVKALSGILKGSGLDENAYKKHLEEKYL